MKLKTLLLVGGVVAGVVIWWNASTPDSENIIGNMAMFDQEIRVGDITYQVEWSSASKRYIGDVQDVTEAYNKYAPFNTHQVLITTGDFSDPSKVEIIDGQIKATLEEDIKGELKIVHLVPKDLTGLTQLRRISVGQRIVITGKEEIDGEVKGSDGGYIRFGTSVKGRPLVLVSAIKFDN